MSISSPREIDAWICCNGCGVASVELAAFDTLGWALKL